MHNGLCAKKLLQMKERQGRVFKGKFLGLKRLRATRAKEESH